MPPFLPQRQQVGVKVETTEGTDAVIAAANLIAPPYDIEYAPSFEMFPRDNLQASLSQLPQVAGERSVVLRFATEIKGSGTAGTAPPNLSAPLKACGFGETIVASTSVTYAPASENVDSVTIEIREADTAGIAKIFQVLGCRGNVAFEAVKGDIVLARFEFTGRYIEPTEGSMLATQVPTPLPVSFLGAAFSFQGIGTLKVQTVTLDMGNKVNLRNDANQVSGNFSAVITNRIPSGSIDPERELIATINTFNKLTTNAEGILTYVLGSTAGNITTITVPKAQIINLTPADRDGLRIETLDLQLNQSVTAGDDEISIAFT